MSGAKVSLGHALEVPATGRVDHDPHLQNKGDSTTQCNRNIYYSVPDRDLVCSCILRASPKTVQGRHAYATMWAPPSPRPLPELAEQTPPSSPNPTVSQRTTTHK